MELTLRLGVHENGKAACVPQFLFSFRVVDQFKEVRLDLLLVHSGLPTLTRLVIYKAETSPLTGISADQLVRTSSNG